MSGSAGDEETLITYPSVMPSDVCTEHLTFRYITSSASGKTMVLSVLSKNSGALLGKVVWRATWRKYVFEPDGDTVFDAICLRDIAGYIEALTREHKQKGA